MKRPQTKLHAHTMSDPNVIRSKKSNFIIRSKFIVIPNFLEAEFFSRYRYFIKVTTTDFDMFLQV